MTQLIIRTTCFETWFKANLKLKHFELSASIGGNSTRIKKTKPVYPQPSKQLISQAINQRAIADLLVWQNRTQWENKYNAYDLTIEVWAVGIWVKEAGLISYQTLAQWLKYVAQIKAWQLGVIPKGDRLLLVQGKQQPWYAVVNQEGQWRCECALYRCFNNRIKAEMPLLYESLEKQIFCHHTEAAKQRNQNDREVF